MRSVLTNVRSLISRLRQRRLSIPYILLAYLPKTLFLGAYLKLAKRLNDSGLNHQHNVARLTEFHRQHPSLFGNHYYVIVMPNTLHYLIPCLQLIPKDNKTILVFNGCHQWEKDLLAKRFSTIPSVSMRTLPFSSINHGPMINAFFAVNQQNFGIIDHDLYLFDPSVLSAQSLQSNSLMRAVFSEQNADNGLRYPHTFFMFFDIQKIHRIMVEYQVDAGICKDVTQRVGKQLSNIGLSCQRPLKPYLNYFDTLQVIIALGFCENLQVEYFSQHDIFHLGGTSMGSQYTKDLAHVYIALRFLERLADHEITNHYIRFFAPFTESEQIWALLPATVDTVRMRETLDIITKKLDQALSVRS